MKIKELVKILDDKYKFENQEEWDKCGVLSDIKTNQLQEITKVIVSLDITLDLIEKAIKSKSNLIITHHPIYVGELEEQTNQDWIETVIKKLNENNIVHIALHTCYDMHHYGTSFQIIRHLFNVELDTIKRLDTSKYCDYTKLCKPISINKLVKQLNKTKFLSCVKYLDQYKNLEVQTIGVVGGSGFSELSNILSSSTKIDCLLTGDVKWHNFVDSQQLNYPVIDIGHDAEWLGMYSIYLELYKQYNLEFETEFVKPLQINIK